MANVVRFGEGRYRVAGRAWSALDGDGADEVALLNVLSAEVPNPGPQDGFTTVDRHLARMIARELGGEVLELDVVEIPPPPPDGRRVDY